MENYVIVRPEHLNHHGNLFGGSLLKWVDEYAWIAAALEFPECTLVTIGMDRVAFHQKVTNGAILRFITTHSHTGKTSVTYNVEVFDKMANNLHVFSTAVTFVRLNEKGEKQLLPPRVPKQS